MTSAIYLNNIPRLGDASHAIRMICFDAQEAPKFITNLNDVSHYKCVYFIENFCDFLKYKDGVDLFNSMKFSSVSIKIFISEDQIFIH